MINVQNSKFLLSAVTEAHYPKHDQVEVILLGRSNVGKSTFINTFCRRKQLAKTSSKPGKTQLLNFFEINDELVFVDVPGYGYAKVSKKQREEFGAMIEEYLTTRANLKFACLLIDFKVGPTEDDQLMYTYLKHLDLPVLVVATKLDKIKKSARTKQENMIKQKLMFSAVDQFVTCSAEDFNTYIKVYNTFEEMLVKGYEESV
ncbi:MAG: ribosome biogenesis GTP-binding protein YihA/YsxC [Mycoplasmatales bacterium]